MISEAQSRPDSNILQISDEEQTPVPIKHNAPIVAKQASAEYNDKASNLYKLKSHEPG